METEVLNNGEFTLENPEGFHLTFRIKTSRNGQLKGKRIVSLMEGSDNEAEYTGFGILDETGFHPWGPIVKSSGQIRISKRNPANGTILTIPQLTACVELIREHGLIGEIGGEKTEKTFLIKGREYRLMASTSCIRCNRKLTNPESVRNGIGPECIKMV